MTGRTFGTVPGGKGANQAVAAARAGGRVAFLGAVGDDGFGRRIADVLASAGVDVTGLVVSDRPTGTAHITVDGTGENSIVVVPGANATLTALTEAHRAGIDAADLLLMQLELPVDLMVEAARYAWSRDVRVILTPAPAVVLPPALLDAVDVLVANEHEAALLAGVDDLVAAAMMLARQCGDVVVTLGARGALRVQDGVAVHVPAFAVESVDTTAAGDTFAGVLAVGLVEGLGWGGALRRASAAAALSVQRPGASSSMPDRGQINAFLAGQDE